MEAEAAKLIGAGIAALAMGGVGMGLGNLFGQFLNGAMRNPSAASQNATYMFIGAALTEALGIFAFLIAILLMYAV